MSQENVEIVRDMYAETAEGRFETRLHLFDPDVEYSRSGESAVGLDGEWRGVQAMVKASMDWIQTFSTLRVEAERFIDAGDSVVVFTRHVGTARASGLPVDEQFADVMTLRDGLVVRFEQFRDRTKALEAAGLSE